jgi:hypothetical protein
VKAFLSEENKKSLGRLLGLERGPGHPRGRRKPGKSFDLTRKISVQRESKSETRKTRQGKRARRTWKEVGRDVHISDQAARQRSIARRRILPKPMRKNLLRASSNTASKSRRESGRRKPAPQHLEKKSTRAIAVNGEAKAAANRGAEIPIGPLK